MKDIEEIAINAKKASLVLAGLSSDIKNNALDRIAKALVDNKEFIISQNEEDLKKAKILLENGEISQSIYDRLKLSDAKFNDMVAGVLDVKKLPDPINRTLSATKIDEDLELYKVSCPIGVIGVIFEARPDVIVQISSLAIKSSNAVILKGGIEAILANTALVKIINDTLSTIVEFPDNVINFVKSREDVNNMLSLDNYIDLIIPRGSNKLVQFIKGNTKIPVLGHSDGICHIFADESANIDLGVKVAVDSKIQYPAACNALETLLVSEKIADKFLPLLKDKMFENNVKLRGCDKTRKIISDIDVATDDDWKTEYGDKILSIKIVSDIDEAINHINTFGSGHTDCIISESKQNVEKFMALVDSAGVYHNVSTRFADGFRYGLGAEVGISTNKTHARGPVGLEGLTIYKYKLFGNGQIVAEYTGENAKKFLHGRIF
ncbi:MAG: glutamate-5-semialdehyde dehydrogenase [Candidatus Gastranaerophilales bacterium]|nr:glutamate-5-semialdehyde dehydrogenase [Candidatus Gastranaerophilales bacterium]